MLEMRRGQPSIARATHATAVGGLGDEAFHSGAEGVQGPELACLLPLAGLLQDTIVCLG